MRLTSQARHPLNVVLEYLILPSSHRMGRQQRFKQALLKAGQGELCPSRERLLAASKAPWLFEYIFIYAEVRVSQICCGKTIVKGLQLRCLRERIHGQSSSEVSAKLRVQD